MIDDDDLNVEIIVEDSEEQPTRGKGQGASKGRKLSKYDQAWIGVPIIEEGKKVGEITKELDKCSGREILSWAYEMYPPARTLGYESLDFESRKKKEELFYYILGTLKVRGVFVNG